MRLIASLLLLAACATEGSQEAGGPTGGGKADGTGSDSGSGSGTFVEAPHATPPVVVSNGGPVLTAPHLVPIFFANDAARPTLEGLLSGLVDSPYWAATTSEYGVGALTVAPSVVVTDAPPVTDQALQEWLAARYPTPDPNTIYTVFLPDGVLFTFDGMTSCVGYGGYHGEIQGAIGSGSGGNGLVYALVPRCPSKTGGPLDYVTGATSHELIEAATDPHPYTAPAYNSVGDPYWTWAKGYTELGDMCSYVTAATQPLIGSYVVQRTWSNKAAAAGHDPCVPALAEPYIAAAPAVASQTVTYQGTQYSGDVLAMPVGSSQTVEVDLFSDAPTDDFTVALSSTLGNTADFTAVWDKQSGHNGDKLHVTLTRNAAAAGSSGDMLAFDVTRGGVMVSEWWTFVIAPVTP